MSKRLQVLLAPSEYSAFQQMARAAGLSLGEWVRQALRQTTASFSQRAPRRKLEKIRQASRHQAPSGNIEQMLDEIEKGYL